MLNTGLFSETLQDDFIPTTPKEDPEDPHLSISIQDMDCMSASQQADRFHSIPKIHTRQHLRREHTSTGDSLFATAGANDHLNAIARGVQPSQGPEMKIALQRDHTQKLTQLTTKVEGILDVIAKAEERNNSVFTLLCNTMEQNRLEYKEHLKTQEEHMQLLKAKDEEIIKAKNEQIQMLMTLSSTRSRKRSRTVAFGDPHNDEKVVDFEPGQLKASLQSLLVTTPETRSKGVQWYPVIELPPSCRRQNSRDYLVNVALLRAALPGDMQNVRLVDIKGSFKQDVDRSLLMPEEALHFWSREPQDVDVTRSFIAANLKSGRGDKFMSIVKHAFIVLTLDELKKFVEGATHSPHLTANMREVKVYMQNHKEGVLYGVLNFSDRRTHKRHRHNQTHTNQQIKEAELPRYQNVTELTVQITEDNLVPNYRVAESSDCEYSDSSDCLFYPDS